MFTMCQPTVQGANIQQPYEVHTILQIRKLRHTAVEEFEQGNIRGISNKVKIKIQAVWLQSMFSTSKHNEYVNEEWRVYLYTPYSLGLLFLKLLWSIRFPSGFLMASFMAWVCYFSRPPPVEKWWILQLQVGWVKHQIFLSQFLCFQSLQMCKKKGWKQFFKSLENN